MTYLKRVDGVDMEMSADEIAQRQAEEAAWAAGADARHNAAIDAQIAALEQAQLLPRGVREVMLVQMVREGAALGLTEPQLYAAQNGYHKLKDLDEQVKALRARRV